MTERATRININRRRYDKHSKMDQQYLYNNKYDMIIYQTFPVEDHRKFNKQAAYVSDKYFIDFALPILHLLNLLSAPHYSPLLGDN